MSNRLLWLLAGCIWSAAAASLGETDAQALLKQSDLRRNGWSSYVGRVKITNYESGKADEEHLYQVPKRGRTRLTWSSSAQGKGHVPADVGDDMWVYLPDTRRPVRITPLERLTGDASNGDVARPTTPTTMTPCTCAGRSAATPSATCWS